MLQHFFLWPEFVISFKHPVYGFVSSSLSWEFVGRAYFGAELKLSTDITYCKEAEDAFF